MTAVDQHRIIHESAQFVISVRADADGRQHIVKQVAANNEPAVLVQKLHNEWELTRTLTVPGARRATQLEVADGRTQLILEYIAGTSIGHAFKSRHFRLQDTLQIAAKILVILADLHQQRIIHKDLNSKNILLGEDGATVTIIDFGLSTRLSLKSDYAVNTDWLEGSLAYISPEQTGRMNRIVDTRSDLYSFGVVLYEMLTGALPFVAADPMEYIYSHIAKVPPAPTALRPGIPEILSQLVMRLLAKDADERYQSAQGVKHDLDIILQAVAQGEAPGMFTLAQADFSGRLHIPQKLFGRDVEIAALLQSFAGVDAGLQVNILTGYSGLGKSSLVQEIHKPVTERRGFFLEGKFDQFQRSTPYQVFIQAFKLFAQQLLTEKEEKLAAWKGRIVAALGDNAGLLTALIPDLEWIIGRHERPAEFNPIESQNRFNYTFLHFLKEIASADRPLVLFLDDMQWTDLASLDLVKQIILNGELRHMLLILSYRDNEVSGEHPLMVLLNNLKSGGNNNITTLPLAGLSAEDVSRLLTDTLHAPAGKVSSLAALITRKTDGNPYFINELLKQLYANDLIRWSPREAAWQWDESGINEISATANVVDLLTRQLQLLPEAALDKMKYASCIGSKVSVQLLAEATGQSLQAVGNSLMQLMEAGYLIPLQQPGKPSVSSGFTHFRFVHDRFQQAIYSLIDAEACRAIHYKIGHILLRDETDRDDVVFEAANHLNQCIALVTAGEERQALCELNYKAGIKARLSNAHEAALHYLKQSYALLGAKSREQDSGLAFKILLAKAEAEYLNLHFEEADKNIDLLLTQARDTLEKAHLYQRKLIHYVTIGRHEEALQISRIALGLVGINIPKSRIGIGLKIAVALLRAKMLYRKIKPEALEDLPELSSEKGRLVASILSQTVTPAYFFNQEFYILLILTMNNYSLTHGNSPAAAHAYVSYGILCNALFGKYGYAYALGKASLQVNERYFDAQTRGKLTTNLMGGIYHWVLPLKDSFDEFYEGYKFSVEGGDFNYAAMSAVTVIPLFIRSGRNLQAIQAEFSEYRSLIEKTDDVKVILEYGLYNLFIDDCAGLITAKAIKEFEARFEQSLAKNKFNLGYLYTMLTMMYVLKGETLQAAHYARKALRLRTFFRSAPLEIYAVFFSALAICDSLDTASPKGRKTAVKQLRSSIAQFEKWAGFCTESFAAYVHFLKAELAKHTGRIPAVLETYKAAIQEARRTKITHIEALAGERLARYCAANSLQEIASIYERQACELYYKWGATAKAAQMEAQSPALQLSTRDRHAPGNDTLHASVNTASAPGSYDLLTMMKASTALANEVRFGELLRVLMRILIENAGAQRGYFILEKDKSLLSAGIDEQPAYEDFHFILGIPKKQDGQLPLSLIQYVYRTGRYVVLDNAATDTRFSDDAYFTMHQPRSVMCMPVVKQGETIGIIYLENNLVESAFTHNRVELLKLLSGQVAVSIENTLLYENLEQKVAERTLQLSQEKKKSDDLLLNILPEEVAAELKATGRTEARLFENVSVLFTDFVDFTGTAEKMSPQALVQELHECFTAFDAIMEKNGLEKIKTIGDAYMAVCGLPLIEPLHAKKTVQAALEIRDFIEERRKKEPAFLVRIGINSGPVVAGVVGVKKFAYDIWGDTVNTAARMEQHGHIGKVNISQATYELAKDSFAFEYRGRIAAKNKGEVEMYFVEEEASIAAGA